MRASTDILKKQLLNAIEHALMEDEISIEKYESLVRAVNNTSADDRFTVIPMDVEKIVVILP
jgi:nitrogen regulatory protein PII-like uncharacterized protein